MMSFNSVSLFTRSGHPKILRLQKNFDFPNPSEWKFYPGEMVLAWIEEDKFQARVEAVDSAFLEVKADDTGEVSRVQWVEVTKCMKAGDFVEVVAGIHTGRKGFVVEDPDDIDVSIVETLEKPSPTSPAQVQV